MLPCRLNETKPSFEKEEEEEEEKEEEEEEEGEGKKKRNENKEKNNSLCCSREVKSCEFRFIMKFHDLNETVATEKAAESCLRKLIRKLFCRFR